MEHGYKQGLLFVRIVVIRLLKNMFCTSCGKEMDTESKFCTSCGMEVEAVKNEETVAENMPRWKKALGGVVGVLVFLIAFGVVKYAAQESFSPSMSEGSSASVEQDLIEASKEINKQLPMMIDSATQMSATMAVGKDFVYLYKLIGEDYGSITQADISSSLRGGIISGVCTTPEIRKMLDKGARLVYRYSNEQGVHLGEISVTLSDCK